MKTISVADMRILEENAFSRGVTVIELMEKAGKGCAELIKEKIGTEKNILIFCGPGNNGGDGLVCARYLAKDNTVTIVIPISPKTDTARLNLKLAKDAGVRVLDLDNAENEVKTKKFDMIIDALLGIGAKGSLRGLIKQSCQIINNSKGVKVSIDIPTGIDGDSGEKDVFAVIPDIVIGIHAIKLGIVRSGIPSKRYVIDIEL